MCRYTHTEMHTDTQSCTHRHRYTHTPPAISTVIQHALQPDSSSFSEPLKGNNIWGRKGMIHTEIKRYINVHLQNGQYTYVTENTTTILWNAICDGGSAKPSPLAPRQSQKLPSPSWSHSPFLCPSLWAYAPLTYKCALQFHRLPPPAVITLSLSLFFKFCLWNNMFYSKNLK